MRQLEKSLRAIFEDMTKNGFYDWQMLEEIKRLHRLNKLGNKIIKLAKSK